LELFRGEIGNQLLGVKRSLLLTPRDFLLRFFTPSDGHPKLVRIALGRVNRWIEHPPCRLV